ncbi:DUF3137 domain-containing protein [Oceanobacillus profundus]|uniref:DUF3137 domain-containing protein n=1 Tax=Oceanobacillus profundus TaxID=372463 RepID=A0A417YMY0_9BACI|nr:DUF3137 domain-containing protein [Oceanobacillus profundus]MCM3398226.1 DUF3137 domain-containing protein [Oceanobacillus profundus]RHW35059.1 DUF3137 domain-containing protein [Oceanobacillus profundus]
MFSSYDEISYLLKDDINEMNKIRFKTLLKYIFGWIFLFASIIIPAIFGLSIPNAGIQWLAAFIFFFGTIASIVSFFKTLGTFRMAFKRKVVRSLLKALFETANLPEDNPNYEMKWGYSSQGKINNLLIGESGLFYLNRIDRVSGEDLIKGKIGSTDFYFSELKLFKQVRDYRGRSNTKLKTRYQGVLYLADFHKHFKGHTVLRDRKLFSFQHLKRYFRHHFHRMLSGKKLITIKMENDEFNKYFKVRTTSEFEARYILSANLMEDLVAFRKRNRNPIDIAFKKRFISLFLYNKKDYFEPSIFDSMEKQSKLVYDDLILFFRIINDLNLNTRIWSKD